LDRNDDDMMMTKVNLTKLGRCAVCGTLLKEMALALGKETCSELCERAKAASRSRDEQEKWEGIDKRMSEMGKKSRKRTPMVLVPPRQKDK
jgi:hypothetical protein